MDAFNLISSSKKSQNDLLGKNSILNEQYQSELFNGLISREIDEFSRPIGEIIIYQGLAAMTGLVIGKALGYAFGKTASKVTNVGMSIPIQFEKTENQVYHAFRHTDALGLDRTLVQSTIRNNLKTVSNQIATGKPFNHIIEIGGQRIQYTAFKFADGVINIGRIHGIK